MHVRVKVALEELRHKSRLVEFDEIPPWVPWVVFISPLTGPRTVHILVGAARILYIFDFKAGVIIFKKVDNVPATVGVSGINFFVRVVDPPRIHLNLAHRRRIRDVSLELHGRAAGWIARWWKRRWWRWWY